MQIKRSRISYDEKYRQFRELAASVKPLSETRDRRLILIDLRPPSYSFFVQPTLREFPLAELVSRSLHSHENVRQVLR